MDKIEDIRKTTYEVKIKDGLTLCYKESITKKGLIGFIKEMEGACSQGKDLEELIEQVLKAKEAIEFVKEKYSV